MFVTGSSFNANVNTACFSNAVCNLVSIITGCASIGSTSAPSSTLDITKSSPDPFNTVQCQISLINGGGNSGAGSQLNFNIGGAIPHIRGLVDGVNSNAGAALVFATACFNGVGIERMRISNTGCIGIGAISPQATVHICTVNTTANLRVESACDQAGLRLIAGVSGVARATRIDFLNGATCVGRPQWSIINDYNQNGTNDLRFINCDPATSLFSITQSGIACFACRVCAPTFLASTNIGINDASPSAKLQINCTNTWGDQVNESINIVNSGANGNINIQHNMGAFTWYSGAVKTAAITAWRNTPSSGNFVDLAFATATAGTQVERMRIMSNGAVGISCATPTYTLDVSGTVRIGNGGRLYINQLLPLGIVFRNDEFPDGDANNTQVSDTAATNGNAKRRLSSAPSTTFFYGPYTTIPAGTYIAYFRLKVANNSSSSNIVYIDITNAVIPGGGVNIAPNAFAASNRYQYFKIPFIVTDPTAVMEFRGLSFVSGITDLFLDHVMILPGS
jgi:hypothetical protein